LKVIVASLNRMRHSTGSQWSCLRSAVAEGKARVTWSLKQTAQRKLR